MNVLSVSLIITAIILLLILTVDNIIKLFKKDKPTKKKRTASIEEARNMLWQGYTNTYFDFD